MRSPSRLSVAAFFFLIMTALFDITTPRVYIKTPGMFTLKKVGSMEKTSVAAATENPAD